MKIREFLETAKGPFDLEITPKVAASKVLEKKISVDIRYMDLISALREVLPKHDLDCVQLGETLIVTTPEAAGSLSLLRPESPEGVRTASDVLPEDCLCRQNLERLGFCILHGWEAVFGENSKRPGAGKEMIVDLLTFPTESRSLLAWQKSVLYCEAGYGLPPLDGVAIVDGDLSTVSYEWTDDQLTDSTPGDKPILWDRRPSHGGARHVLFADGSVKAIPENEFQKVIMKFEEGRSKGRPPDIKSTQSPLVTLKFLHATQLLWYQEDFDRNGVNDYWTRDVAGMYFGLPSAHMLAAARADKTGCRSYPRLGEPWPLPNGYWVKAMTFDDEGNPYATDTDGAGAAAENYDSFAFCAYPVGLSDETRYVYIMNETGNVWQKERTKELSAGIDKWPAKDPCEKGWRRVIR